MWQTSRRGNHLSAVPEHVDAALTGGSREEQFRGRVPKWPRCSTHSRLGSVASRLVRTLRHTVPRTFLRQSESDGKVHQRTTPPSPRRYRKGSESSPDVKGMRLQKRGPQSIRQTDKTVRHVACHLPDRGSSRTRRAAAISFPGNTAQHPASCRGHPRARRALSATPYRSIHLSPVSPA